MTLFTREDVETALGHLARELAERGVTSTIQIVGGAALALRHFDRASTRDVDISIRLGDPAQFHVAASAVATRMGWDQDWINDESAKYIPRFGRTIAWETIYEQDGIVIQVAPADSILAMKLRANRPGRDNADIARLMAICGLSTLEELENLYAEFWPNEALADRAVQIVEKILDVGIPNVPPTPPTPRI